MTSFPNPLHSSEKLPNSNEKSHNQKYNSTHPFPIYPQGNMSALLKMEAVKNMASDRELKQKMALWVQVLITVYLIGIFLIIIYYMLFKIYNISLLSDAVLITILTTTTLNLLGMPFIVLKSLFKDSEGE
jgi:hypothetical protein